jgi:hypothetical protein
LCSRVFDYDKSRYQVESGKEGFAQLVVAGKITTANQLVSHFGSILFVGWAAWIVIFFS